LAANAVRGKNRRNEIQEKAKMTGHVRRRGNGSWELKFDIGTDPLTGKRLTRYSSFKGTKRDAQKKLAGLVTAAEKGELVDTSRVTLAAFLDRWERDWAANNVSPKTLERYKELAQCHVRPHLGAAQLQKIKPLHFAELYAKLLRDEDGPGLAPRTVGHVHRVLHRALGHAVEWGLLVSNPVSVKPPKVEGAEIEILSEDQVRVVLRSLREKLVYPLVALGLTTGMRRGELLALRWRDVDLDASRLKVEQSLEQTKAGLRFKPPKTRYGRRMISLPATVVAELRSLRKSRAELRLKLGQRRPPDDALVFGTLDGQPRSPNAVTKEWARAVAQLGLPRVSLHALRHTHASQLIASGMDVLTISRRLGHGSPTITLGVYGHLFSNSDDRAAQVMEAAFTSASTEQEQIG
jgi:integrase